MTEKIEVQKDQNSLHKEEIGVEAVSTLPSESKLGEVGVIDAPDGGRAAWMVVFGSFCVSKSREATKMPF
jgi:hypothetical protein